MPMNNRAYIDGQNLYMATRGAKDPWQVDVYRLRTYLKEKYEVKLAYYFLGCAEDKNQKLYDMIKNAGFELIFREHSEKAISSKKGNVDTDIVFSMMKDFHECPEIDKFYLVSGDGDYFRMIKYLKEQGKLGKMLFPAQHRESALYRLLGDSNFTYLDAPGVRAKIGLKH